ncbi:Probable L-type lectin-domain containing receptor kinase S.7 [Ancistrocladus abbreviatus]
MANSSRLLLVFFLILNFTIFLTLSTNVNFDFYSLNLRNITLLGDSYLRNGVVGLTGDLPVPATSSGAVIYNSPIEFFNSEANITASFSTRFSFAITNVDPSSYGDGLTFFISPDNQTLGSPGGYLGLVNSTQLTKNRFVAIEFDTKLDPHFQDPNDNHLGLDIDSLVSIETVDLTTEGIYLKNGKSINVWIDYKNEEKTLRVFVNHSIFKPKDPVLDVGIDLSHYLKEFMYVGFSGSTEGSTELHLIESWSFQTSGFLPVRSSFSPHNVSDSSVFTNPQIQVSGGGKNHNKKIGLGLGIAGPAFCCALLVIFGWVSIKKWKGVQKQRSFKAEIVTGPKQFSYKELKAATRGFHSGRIVGHGAFGTVYKAFFISSGTISAVKRSRHTHEGKAEFLAELSIIACLRHKNLVQLQGWCVEKGELLLVYEFMPNGSLDKVLYPESQTGNSLPWPCRYNIAVGLASVLTYMHQECEQQIIHRDIKTSNIMLDGNFNARLGDFGLARLMDHDKSPVSTLTAGTMGYLAPEYLQCGKATEKTDTFSYGVVILEVACGRRPIERETDGQKVVNLVDWVWALHSEGKILEAADKRLNGEFDEEEMKRLLLIGLSCANPDCLERPNMRRVLQILNKEADPSLVPRSKPTLTFSNSLPLRIEDIFCDDEETKKGGQLQEVKVDQSENSP